MLTDFPVLVALIIIMLWVLCTGFFFVIIQIKNTTISFKYSVGAVCCFLFSYFIYYGLTIQTHAGVVFIK